MKYDGIIIGAGLYGLYAAEFLAKKGKTICVLEKDSASFSRATYVNQARVHMGYHYPRSYATAIKSANYFNRFVDDYGFSILQDFEKVYATSAKFSWTNAEQFQKFCKAANVYCESINPLKYFQRGMCDGAFHTKEYTYDAMILKEHFLNVLAQYDNVTIQYNVDIVSINKDDNAYEITLDNQATMRTEFVLNATYASTNQILALLQYEPFKIKYELCEIILCKVSDNMKDVGITVMDGPFFSLMPFGKTGYHSLTSVTFTPHEVSYDTLPTFSCQKKSRGYCTPQKLGNCNQCPAKPKTAWVYMSSMAKKYLAEDIEIEYVDSLFSMKPILVASEIDDSRPTIIKQYSEKPYFFSVFSGKINTIYDLDEVLSNV